MDMPIYIIQVVLIYISVISLISIFVTIYDKSAAKKHKQRISENTLILLSLLGGSVAMLATMKLIRHKTKHKKFMLGIPAIIILQVVLVLSLIFLN